MICITRPYPELREEIRDAFMRSLHNVSERLRSEQLPREVGVLEVETPRASPGPVSRVGTVVARVRVVSERGEKVYPAEITDSRQSVTGDDIILTVRIRGSDLIR